MGSSQAKKRGAQGDQVDHRGRWVPKKGSRIVNAVYIDPEDIYADAFVGSKLCLGGPIRYKVEEAVAAQINTDWIGEHVVPSIAKQYGRDHKLIDNLGMAMLYVIMDEDASLVLFLETDLAMVQAVRAAYNAIPVENKPEQPIQRISLHVYRIGEDTFIEEVWNTEQAGAGTRAANNTGDALAQIPAGGGTGAVQQVLQTLVIQIQQLQRQHQEQEERHAIQRQADRAWMEDKLRRLNDNVKRFGGSIPAAFSRQDRGRQLRVAQDNEEEAAAEQQGTTINEGNRQWPTLCPNLHSLLSLWTEYEFGIGGRKPAKAWTREERGHKRQKQTYYRRNCIWKIQLHLMNKGYRIEAANALIRRTYGETTSLTNIAKAIVNHRAAHKAHGGLHPNFR
jgi:hypothetical protein